MLKFLRYDGGVDCTTYNLFVCEHALFAFLYALLTGHIISVHVVILAFVYCRFLKERN